MRGTCCSAPVKPYLLQTLLFCLCSCPCPWAQATTADSSRRHSTSITSSRGPGLHSLLSVQLLVATAAGGAPDAAAAAGLPPHLHHYCCSAIMCCLWCFGSGPASWCLSALMPEEQWQIALTRTDLNLPSFCRFLPVEELLLLDSMVGLASPPCAGSVL